MIIDKLLNGVRTRIAINKKSYENTQDPDNCLYEVMSKCFTKIGGMWDILKNM